MARRKDGPVEVVRPKAAFSASERPLNVSVSLHDLAGRACRQVWEAVQDPDDFVAARMLAKITGKGRDDVSEQGKNGNPLVDGMTRSFPWIALSPKDSLSDDDQPDWIKQCRARVIDMAAGDVVVSPKDVANSLPPRLESRVAVASQDGSVWIFRKHASDNQQSRRVSFDGQYSPRSASSSPSATPPIPSTPASRSARSRPLKVRTVSSSSISLCPTSPTLQETSFRPQKASATVGLSTSDTASLPTESFTATHITSPSISSIHDHITNPHVSAPSNQSSPKNPSSGSAPKLEVSLSGQEGSPSSPLEPLVRLTTATNDLNVAILVTNATRYAMLEANVIVALTKRGALSVHSLLDGRCLERKTLPRAHYHSMQVLTLEKTVVLACHSHSATRIVDSNSLLELANVELGACVSSVALEDGPGLAVYALHKDRLQKYAITRKDDQSVASRLVSFLPFDDHDADQDDGSAHADEVEDEDYWRGLCAVGSRVAAFNDDSIIVFEDKSNKIEVMARASFPSCQKLQSCTSTSFIAVSDHSVSLLVLQISSTKSTIVKARSLALEGVEALALMEADQAAPSLLVARATDTARDLHLCTLSGSEASTSVVFNAPVPQTFRHRPALFVQSKAGTYIIGTTDGEIYESQLSKIDISKDPIDQLCGCITFMCLHTLGDAEVLIVGCADGVAAAWYTKDWQRLGSWTLFASPVVNAVPFEDMDGAPTFVFVSANSPTALVSLFPPKMHFILPGTKSAPELIATFNGEVLILYEHGLARICHLESRELRRSMDRKTAEGVLAQSAWRVWYNSKEVQQQDPTFLALTKDVRALLDEANRSLPWKEKTNGADTPVNGHNSGTDVEFKAQKSRQLKMNGTITKSQVDSFIRFALSHLLDFSLSSSMNEIAFEHLNISPPTQRLRFGLTSDLVVPPFAFDSSGWTISGVVTAHRLLKIICLLRAYLNFPHTERHATQLIVYYASEIADAVGGKFQPPCLVTLSEYWLDRSPEVQAAVQVLFGAYLLSRSDNEVRALVDDWSTMLPCREKGSSPHHGTADQALLLIGLVAVEKYSLLSSSLLKDVANSIVQFMDDFDEPHHQAIAVELSSRGFHIWQNYVDAMSLARQLFTLATGQDARPPADLRAQAKLASLHLSSTNTPLFITTLSFDILNAKSAESRKATMKLLGLMARKKPLVLYSNLPKLAEVVVKSLDPTVSALRETVHQAATVILNELVRTYPSIDFHGKSQRLAVGTHEGAAIVYDLKTGTRLYVLEGHKKPVTALSWSPDGRRLVSVSLDEGRAVVWKVGVGIFSMFTPGAPPRQSSALAAVSSGSSSSAAGTPYKVIDFNVGDEALMTTAATLEWVAFEWPAERTARLRIRETSLTFPVS